MSGSSARRKGNRAEVDVVRVLREHGYNVETSRAARGGYQSGADIVGDFPMVVEVKNQQKLDLAGWWTQAEYQANGKLPVVIHKRVGKGDPEDWWVTMDLRTLLRLLNESEDVS
jgi:hypothetical protein